MARSPFEMQRQAATFGQPRQAAQEAPPASLVPEEIRGMMEEEARNKEAERAAYQQQIGALRGLQASTVERFAAGRAPQVAAVEALGQRASTLEGGAALLQTQAAREQAQASAMAAGRTMYGNREAGPEAAILGGQIGATQAQAMGALEQEAAARQAAYLRGVQALGAGLMSEAEERRLIEQEQIRDMQARFLAAQRIAAGQQERAAASRQQLMGSMAQLGGTILGAAVGGPAGAAIGGKLGGSFGG
jgi:hypothetical protein